ncbi:hypothetical protein BOX15_Mlig007729g1 [Macrostomum lignano]|uniref:Uncharacterized protein n=2 Tax=Macrostomum lignano TaxID=282301 RepID=A0A267DJJ5_9PLAT|nr:hypothetical protein BOX15_Mlig007729g2 [Macrostomum lignano]PAA49451.1 hypothetical protein BOX15_Mlig012537g1 [Macrostomum lignano]PAA73246.1 hypothetical protein BOX15_Mlig007729g1 [Macrostomum lignano]
MRQSTETLWSSLQVQVPLQSAHSLDWLQTAVQECGLLPLKLSHGCLIQGEFSKSSLNGSQIDELLAMVSIFGCLADNRCLVSSGSNLSCRELDLIKHGASKTGINAVVNAISMAENIGRPICLLLHPWPESEPPVSPAGLSEAMRRAWPSESRCGYRAAVFLLPRDRSLPPVRVEMDSSSRPSDDGPQSADGPEDLLLLPAAANAAAQAAGEPFKVRAVLVTFEMGSAAAAKQQFRGIAAPI